MILRRIIMHVETHNWFAISIDFVIVVVGVFLGIQVSNWNSERLELVQEQELLVRLQEDFVASANGQRRDIEFLAQQFSDQTVILKSLDACNVEPDDALAFERGIVTLGYINFPRFFRRTVDELASAGKTDVIQSDVIKDRLADIVALVEWRGNAIDSVSRSADHHRFTVEEQVRYDLTKSYADPFLGQFFGVAFDIQALCQNSSIASAVSAISQLTKERENAYRELFKGFQELLPLLEQELRDRWQVNVGGETAS